MDCWFKLNIDGASLGSPGKVNGGGLVQDHKGGVAERIQLLHRQHHECHGKILSTKGWLAIGILDGDLLPKS